MHALSLSVRIDAANPDHHLWNNHGTWWCHYTLHRGPRKQRCRTSLSTAVLEEARQARDRLFAALARIGDANRAADRGGFELTNRIVAGKGDCGAHG